MQSEDRGWFTWTAERARALDASAREAAEAASTEDWLEAAWARVTDPAFVAALYASRAAHDPSLAEELERSTSRDAESMRVQKELGAARVGPYLVSRLATSSPQGALQRLALGIDVGRPLSEACVDFEGGPLARMLTLAWAASPHASDRKRAVERLHDPRQTPRVDRVVIAAEAHAAGDPEAAPFVLESLRGLLAHHGVAGVDAGAIGADTSTEECFDREGNLAGRLLRALVARPLIEAAPLLVRSFETHEVLLASIACTRCATPAEADAVERYLHTLVGPLSAIAPLRCGAENVLARLGRPRDLGAARALRARGAARYGYPKLSDVAVLHRLAADAFRGADDATSEERAWVRSLRRSPYALLREVAQLEGAVAPDYWDAARTKATLARGELDRAIDALEDATFASTIFGSLKDVALDEVRRRRVTELACARLEAGPNPYVESTSELDPDAAAAVGFLKTLPDDEKATLATRSSAWIRAFVTETEPLAREPRATRTPEGASIERLDLAPFVIGKKINGLALGGSILAVVGDETAVLVDAQTGLALRRLESTWRWGYDVAFSPDGTCVASVWHGGHVDVHDVASGARRFALEGGHSGVPNGVRSVAWSRDGARLYTGGDDGRLVAWSLEGDAPSIAWTVHEPGGFHAITTFASGDVVASHVKTTGGESNWIARFDGATGAVRERVETKTSIWAIAWRDDDTVATGGEDRLVRIADARKGLDALVASDARTIEAKRTTRLAWEADALFGVTAEGESFVWRAEDTHEGRHATGHALWALAGRFVGGDGGTIDRLAVGVDETSSTTNGATPFAHTRKLIAIVPCGADVITVDWDGTFGRFDLAGRGSLLAALGGTPESAVLANDELFVGMRDAVRVLDVATGTVKREIPDRHDDVALDANGRVLACSHRTGVLFRDAATLAPLGAPVEVGAGSVNAIAALPDGRFVVGTERGELAILASTNGAWARTWHLHAHGRARLERGNPHADVCSLVVSRDGSRFVSAATDRTVRVWDVRDSAGPTPMLRRPLTQPTEMLRRPLTRPTEMLRRPLTRPTEMLRIAEDFGLFNRLALSPDGRRLAIPTSAGLLVYALEEGNGPIADEDPRLVLREPWDGRFAGKQLTVATFVGERELVVGTEAGAVFRVSLGEKVQ